VSLVAVQLKKTVSASADCPLPSWGLPMVSDQVLLALGSAIPA
jgi:hypothetical protein